MALIWLLPILALDPAGLVADAVLDQGLTRSGMSRKGHEVLKLDLAVIVVAVAGGTLWVEQGHRVVIDAPAAADSGVVAAAAACSENDTVPVQRSCLDYLNVSTEPAPRLRVVASFAAPAPCPDNDRVPYSASCIAFLKGATETGMRWRATAEPPSIPAPQ